MIKKPSSIRNILPLLLIPFMVSALYSQERYETDDIDFEFKKTETFDEAALEDILLLPKEKYFNPTTFQEDKNRLAKYYFDNGFFDAIVDTSTTVDREEETINIKFIIIENSRYSIKDFEIRGLENASENVKNLINTEPLIKAGDFYNKNLISSERDRITNTLLNNGYFYAQIDTSRSEADSSRMGIIIGKYSEQLQKNPEYKDKVLVRLTFIGADKQYAFGNIRINIIKNKYGLEKNIIQRELKFKEGELFSKGKMTESERNFTKMPIIQLARVEVDTPLVPTDGRINIAVNVSLSNKYELTPDLSLVYRDNRFFGGAGIEYKDKNFLGDGRVFTVGLTGLVHSAAINNFELTFSLFQPFLFRNNLTATLTSSIGLYNFSEAIEYVYSQNLARFNYFIAEHTFYNSAYSDLTFDYVRTRAKESYLNADSTITPKGTRGYYTNSILGITLIHNSANNIFNPSKGFFHSITAESAGGAARLISLFIKDLLHSQYVKLFTNNSFYFDISGGRQTTIIGKHFEIGDIIEYGGGENIVPVDRLYKFFAGGSTSLRGWGAQEAGILIDPTLGGKFLFEGSLELRRKPFPARSFLNPIWMALFIDYGNVWESDGYFRLDQVALATGFGIRYDTFVGPVRIDVGFRLYDPLARDGNQWLWDTPSDIFKNKWAIQFGLGNAF